MKLISIIVAVYNIEEYLRRCLDSILAQTYDNIEILLVDDGSTDSSAKICDEYGAKDTRITVIHQENRGLSGARNTALKVAKGDYIGFVDGDDYINPDMYERMINAMESSGAMLAGCSYMQVGDGVEAWEYSDRVLELTKEEFMHAYIWDDQPFHIYNSVWSKLFKKELVEGIEFPIGKCSEDITYTGEALAKCNKCVFIDAPLYNYVVGRTDSIMNSSKKLANRRFRDELPNWKRQLEIFREYELSGAADEAEFKLYCRYLTYYMDFKRLKMRKEAYHMACMIMEEKKRIREIYALDFIPRGDLMRMKLFMLDSALFYMVMLVYEDVINPVRNRLKGH